MIECIYEPWKGRWEPYSRIIHGDLVNCPQQLCEWDPVKKKFVRLADAMQERIRLSAREKKELLEHEAITERMRALTEPVARRMIEALETSGNNLLIPRTVDNSTQQKGENYEEVLSHPKKRSGRPISEIYARCRRILKRLKERGEAS